MRGVLGLQCAGLLAGAIVVCAVIYPAAANVKAHQPSRPISAAVIRTARVNVNGVMRTVLTNRAGRTLYFFTFDQNGRVACTTGCTEAWHPVLTRGDTLDLSSGFLFGSFGVIRDANGRQLTYEGHPLYTSDQDTGPAQAHGEGFENAWYVATLDLAPGAW